MKAQPATIEYLSCSPSEAIAHCISELKSPGGKRKKEEMKWFASCVTNEKLLNEGVMQRLPTPYKKRILALCLGSRSTMRMRSRKLYMVTRIFHHSRSAEMD